MSVVNGLDTAFITARSENRSALIPYLTGGFPDPDHFTDLALAVLEAGADALEIGVPFSDPLLDGPAIQRSQQMALDAGVTPAMCMRFAAEIAARTAKPLLFMGAYNPIVAYGIERYCRDAEHAGIAALIVPDVPFEESDELRAMASASNLHVIQFVSVTSSLERIASIAESASGFVYGISVAGVTGARAGVAGTARPLVEAVRRVTDIPVAVGFGIGSPEAAREVAAFADGVIVGSALISVVAEAQPIEREARAAAFVGSLAAALRPARTAGEAS
jgi:tryptophan synthase alpha chain